MNWIRLFSIALLVPALNAWEPWEPQQRKRPERGRAEQTISTPGVLTQQGRYWVEEITGSLPSAPRLRIESAEGGIEVSGAAQQEITYRIRKRVSAGNEESARRLLAEYPLQVRRRADLLVLTVESERGDGINTEYHVTVPRSTVAADLETRGGDVAARDLEGAVRAVTAGGGIEADRIGGAAELETAGGSIHMGAIGGRVHASTAGGNIKLGSSGADAELATAGGNIDVGRAERSVRAQTAGGNITIGTAGGDVTAKTAGGTVTVGQAMRVDAVTAGGSIHVDGARALVRAQTAGGSIRLNKCAGPLRAETAAGSITASIVAVRQAWAESLLATSGGDIIVYLPAGLALTIRAAIEQASTRHRITSDFPLTMRSGSDLPGPREIVGEGPINGGGAPLRLRTISGNIEIRKGK